MPSWELPAKRMTALRSCVGAAVVDMSRWGKGCVMLRGEWQRAIKRRGPDLVISGPGLRKKSPNPTGETQKILLLLFLLLLLSAIEPNKAPRAEEE